jgi:hypothetical protein
MLFVAMGWLKGEMDEKAEARKWQSRGFGDWLWIPAKGNADSEGNVNGIPGGKRTVFGDI